MFAELGRTIGVVARGEMALRDFYERRHFVGTACGRERATRMEATTGGRIDEARRRARNRDQFAVAAAGGADGAADAAARPLVVGGTGGRIMPV